MAAGTLRGRTVIVAGAGLAGLAAARELEKEDARVTILEARDRVGGRVQTVRGIFAGGQHAEAGADLIEGEQTLVLELATSLGLEPQRILRKGFTYYGPDRRGRPQVWRGQGAWGEAAKRFQPEIKRYKQACRQWSSAVGATVGRTSVEQWLRRIKAERSFATAVRAMRGFFLADPEELSLLMLVDLFADGEVPGRSEMFRLQGGNDRLPQKLADSLRAHILLGAHVRRVRQRAEVVTVTFTEGSSTRELEADFVVIALPATTARELDFAPRLPGPQSQAIGSLKYGAATRVLLQFETPFWRRAHRQRGFGTAVPIGAVWDASEHQRGKSGILMLLAGGGASAECRQLIASEGAAGIVQAPSMARRAVGVADPLARELGGRSAGARRLRRVHDGLRSDAAGMAAPSVRSRDVCRRAHQHRVGRIHERRPRERLPRRRRDLRSRAVSHSS